MTLRERLLAGEHHGCATWAEVARKLGVDDRRIRVVRAALKHDGHAIELRPVSNIGKPDNSIEPSIQTREAPVSTARSVFANSESRWPSVAEFDALPNEGIAKPNEGMETTQPIGCEPRASWQPSDFRNPEALPFTHPASPLVHRLTREDCPDGTLILWASDIHVPIQDDDACRLMVECAERNGVTHAIAGGDIFDFNCLSKHAKESRRTVEHATIMEEAEPGRWLLDWFATKKTKLILGNHEDRAKRFIDENPAFHGSVASNFAALVDLPKSIEVVPQGGEVRLGNLSARHLDAELKNSSGGKYPAQKILDMLPDQSTIGGHVHRITMAVRTTRDEDGIRRTRRAWTMGHMSHEHMHYGYVSTTPNWQQGFGFVRVYWEGDRPRFSVYQIEVLRDSRDRPYFEFQGAVHR